MIEIDLVRTNNMIDPQLHIWGWEIPIYLFLGGMAAGLMIVSSLLKSKIEYSKWIRWSSFGAPILLSIGMFALFLDLAFKFHVYRFYLSFEWTSPMSWGAWILMAIYPVTILLGLSYLKSEEISRFDFGGKLSVLKRWSEKKQEGLKKLNLYFGIGLGVYTGILLSSTGRFLWSSSILGPLFLVSGISTGMALLMLFPMSHDEHHWLKKMDMFAMSGELSLLAIYLIGLSTHANGKGDVAIQAFLGGPLTITFWVWVVFVGLLIPLTMEVLEFNHKIKSSFIPPILVLIGGLVLRWLMVSGGQIF